MELGTSYCFDDVLMEPLYSDITTRSSISLETNIGTNSRKLILKTPLISSPMDTVTETQMAIKMALSGGLGIIHRFMTIEEQVSQVIKVKRFLQYIIRNPYRITPNTNYTEVEELINKYGVSTFCVVNTLDDNILVGILTRRDIEAMKYDISREHQSKLLHDYVACEKKNILVKNYMSNYDIGSEESKFLTVDATDAKIKYEPESILKLAKEYMMIHRYEKIPITSPLPKDYDVYKPVHCQKLLGLVTLKNILHWENNHSRACVDTTGALCVGAAIGIIGDYMQRLEALVNAHVDLICIDVANGFNENVIQAISKIRSIYPSLILMVGNVCNADGFKSLADPSLDVDCIRVGIGNGSICTTRLETGIGKGQFSAVSECFQTKRLYNLAAHIICDGGSLGKTGNKVKAIAAGASAIMLGRTLAATEESPGQIIFRNGRRFKYIRGMASTMANLSKQEKTNNSSSDTTSNPNKKLKTDFTSEGVDGEQELSGSVSDLIEQINGGIRSGLSYIGCYNLEEVHEKAEKKQIKFNLVSSIGMSETGIRVKTY
jgi:IMP dehydrogenase